MLEDLFFVMPDDGMETVLAPLAAAQQTIDLYIFTLSNQAMLAALGAAVTRGVAVRALVEPRPSDNAAAGHAAMAALQQAGVAVRPAPSYFDRLHAKAFVVDNNRALISSINFLDDWSQTRDYGLITGNPVVVGGLAQTFAADWASQQSTAAPALPLVLSPGNSRPVIAGLIAQAQQTLLLEEEQITDPAVIAALAARSNAGIQVQLVTNSAQEKNRAPLATLQAQAPGVQIGYSTGHWLHSKLLIADERQMLVGSVNLTPASLDTRREVSLLVADPAAVARAVAVARADLAAAAPQPEPAAGLPRPSDSPAATTKS